MAVFFFFLSIFMFAYIWRFIIRNRHISPSSSTPSTLTTAQPQVIKYDVFLSFRGEDTRVAFTSHLYDALNRKQILTFIDYQLVRGDEISASLLRTIEEAKLSLIVFSENYASSKWCLEELVKIFECRKNKGQIVIPVFYKVDPTHVRHQTGSFGDAFARLIRNKALTLEEVQSFRDALKYTATLSGWPLGNSQPESEFIEKIVGDVLKQLSSSGSSHTTAGLIGIDVRVNKVESLLNINSPDVLILGIWGMGGIGKTTIAQAVFTKVRSQFKGIFSENFRQELETGSMADLQRRFLSQLLGQEILNMGSLSFRDSFVRERLRRKKVFIVLDDVDDLMPLEEWKDLLDGRNSSFGAGSKVIITSRDKQVLSNVVDETYEVEGLNDEEAIQLISSKALKNCIPTTDHMHLMEQIARRVQGNPLALRVLGSSLHDKSIEEWHSALNKLAQPSQIERVLRISYDGLDSEQQPIFLDIAHFFITMSKDEAARILDGLYGRSVEFDISKLFLKCLITTGKFHRLEMHDLLREMAFNIVRAESLDSAGERSRLCRHRDVVQVLKENKGTRKIKGISLDMSYLWGEIHLKSDAFAMMDGLRFLNFYYSDYPHEDEMHLPPTGLEYLPNELRYLQWDGFPSKSLPPSFRAEHLVELHLRESKLVRLWTGLKDVGNLRTIDLSDSPYLTELPDLSMAKNLVSLTLQNCPSLTEVPSSLQYLYKLKEIYLDGCYNIRSFPMLDSKVLRILLIERCLDMTTCPTISQNMEGLWLVETSIKEVPQSVLTGRLEDLNLNGCSKMTKFPENLEYMKSLYSLRLSETGIKELPLSIKDMVCLEVLSLSRTPIKELPLSIKDMVCLRFLYLNGTPIKALPELPPSLWDLYAHDCASLETAISIINIGRLWHNQLDFTNCCKLDQKPLVAAMHLKIQSGEAYDRIRMVLPGSEIPEWFGDKGIGSSVTIQLPSNCHQLKGIAFCLVFRHHPPSNDNGCYDVAVYLDSHGKGINIWFGLSFSLKTCDSDHMILYYNLDLVYHLRKYSGNEVTFKFDYKVKSYGVYLHFDENLPADTDHPYKQKFRRK